MNHIISTPTSWVDAEITIHAEHEDVLDSLIYSLFSPLDVVYFQVTLVIIHGITEEEQQLLDQEFPHAFHTNWGWFGADDDQKWPALEIEAKKICPHLVGERIRIGHLELKPMALSISVE